METTLEQQLAETEKKSVELAKTALELRKKIEKRNNANKPKSIMDRINNMSDILSILGADEKKDVIKIDKFDAAEHEVVKRFIQSIRISKAYNEGWLPKVGENRWYAWWRWVSSGFVFSDSRYDGTSAYTASASRLAFKEEKYVRDAAKKFPDVAEGLITG